MIARKCATCKWFITTPGFNECHYDPPKTTAFVMGLTPPTPKFPRGEPIIHLDVRFAVTDPNFYCSHWGMKIEIAHEIPNGEEVVQIPLTPGNGR